jgi:3-oxoacyl-[acyl-carrier-protein] synthase-3
LDLNGSRLIKGSLKIRGSGVAVPECRGPDRVYPSISNADVSRIIAGGTASDREVAALTRLMASSGGHTRYWCDWIGGKPDAQAPDAVDLALQAAKCALEDGQLGISDIDLVILALSTSTLPTIASTSPLCDRLGHRGPSFDLKAGCAGSLYALHLASVLLTTGYLRVLVIGVDTMSKYMDPDTLKGFPTVGDAAGALVLEAGASQNFVSLLDGEYSTWATAGVFGPLPPRFDQLDAYAFQGAPTRLKERIAEAYFESLKTLLQQTGTTPSDLAAWVPHAMALPVVQAVAARFDGLTLFECFSRYGNTGSASLLLALHEARRGLQGPIALSALGAGMRWGAAHWSDWQ